MDRNNELILQVFGSTISKKVLDRIEKSEQTKKEVHETCSNSLQELRSKIMVDPIQMNYESPLRFEDPNITIDESQQIEAVRYCFSQNPQGCSEISAEQAMQ